MVEERSKLEPEVQKIFKHIDNGDNFLLSGGAGSGKTYSLVQVVKQVISKNPTDRIACMTYTNAAVREIEERVTYKNLFVSTIHNFLWDNIKHFQKVLKNSLINLINDEESKIKNPEDAPVLESYFDQCKEGIQYKEYLKLKDGIISHDEILILANYVFKNYPKLCDILKDKFKFIFIDEYQDADKNFIQILLIHLKQSKKQNIIGFFGDAMQSIYDNGVGDLDLYKGEVKEVKKKQNRRNPELIIELANKLRTDGIKQTKSEDTNAPNMMKNSRIKKGNIKFYYSQNKDKDKDIERVKQKTGWDFEDAKQTKILNLTHNLIAPKAGFSNLMEIYDKDRIIKYKNRIKKYIKDKDIKDDFSEKTFGEVIEILSDKVKPTKAMKDFINSNQELYKSAKGYKYQSFAKIYLDKESLIDDKKQDKDEENKKGSKRDDLIKHLFKIQNNISFYNAKQFNDFLRATEYKITSIQDKKELKDNIIELTEVGDKTIEEIINKADEFGICKKDDKLARFISEKEYLYNRVKKIKFFEFQKLYNYLEGYTPFSTQHKVKGTEFDNVLVILDNGGWNHYNFKGLFENNASNSVRKRTEKIFYVCCTRAKKNLSVFFNSPSEAVITKAKDWFREKNVREI
ncbi:MAG: ATP-dependent helicase [Deltaproteobacteria bacterium]|nr:ATP-dependent helicase [Deltaproteobacteria bacterium]